MRIAIGCDHAGFELKQHVVGFVRELGHEVLDLGTTSRTSPASSATIPGAAPLYGMWTIVTPAIPVNSTPERCVEDPLPAEL